VARSGGAEAAPGASRERGGAQWSRRGARSQAQAEAAARARFLADMRSHFAEVRKRFQSRG